MLQFAAELDWHTFICEGFTGLVSQISDRVCVPIRALLFILAAVS
jgi:hypothetical protein